MYIYNYGIVCMKFVTEEMLKLVTGIRKRVKKKVW